MTALVDFLLARIADDEAEARKWIHHAQQNDLIVRDPKYLGMFMPGWQQWRDIEAFASRVLAECEAKRRIVEAYAYLSSDPELRTEAWTFALRALTLPYDDHPDYDQAWRVAQRTGARTPAWQLARLRYPLPVGLTPLPGGLDVLP